MSVNESAPAGKGNGLQLVAFCCANSSGQAAELSKAAFGVDGVEVRLVQLACSSKIEVLHVLRALENGADGVALWTCPDKACKFGRGSIRAGKRIERARRIVDEIGVGAQRVFLQALKPSNAKDLDRALKDTIGELKKLGKNPLKNIGETGAK